MRRDPAPSRLAYRAERLWLKPRLRRFCKLWLPTLFVLGSAGLWLAQPETRRLISDQITSLRHDIEARPEFQVTLIGIEGASADLAQEIRVVLGIDLPISSFDLPLEDLRARIEGLPAVATAELRVERGGFLAVDIVERQPSFVWMTRGGPVLIDAGGVFVAALSDRPETPPLPQVAGEGVHLAIDEAARLFAIAAPLGQDLLGLVRVGERRWDLVLSGERRILLPETGAPAALARVMRRAEAERLFERDVVAVDMRLPDRPVLRLSQPAIEALRAARQGLISQEDTEG
ncbi:MAG: cell division protein FtsQ/DivIB [Pseudomonadota bacterium]